MTKPRFAKLLACAVIAAATLAGLPALAQEKRDSQAKQDAAPVTKPGKPIRAGDVLSGELTALRVRSGNKGKRVATYQINSEPRRLPPPNGLCDLETGPETFQLITRSDAQVAQLKGLVGKEISVKVEELSCADVAGEMAEAVVTKWSVVKQ